MLNDETVAFPYLPDSHGVMVITTYTCQEFGVFTKANGAYSSIEKPFSNSETQNVSIFQYS